MISETLRITGKLLDDLKTCCFSLDRTFLIKVEKEFEAHRNSLLSCAEKNPATGSAQSDVTFITALPSLLKIWVCMGHLSTGIRKLVEQNIRFPEQESRDVAETMALTKDLSRDVSDSLAAGKAEFSTYTASAADRVLQKADEACLSHLQRLTSGVCSVRVSYYYLDIMDCLKRLGKELGLLARQS